MRDDLVSLLEWIVAILLPYAQKVESVVLSVVGYLKPLWFSVIPAEWIALSEESGVVVKIAPASALLVFVLMLTVFALRDWRLRRITGDNFRVRTLFFVALAPFFLASTLLVGIFAAAGPFFLVKQEIVLYEQACVGVGLDISASSNAGTVDEDRKAQVRFTQAVEEMRRLTEHFIDGQDQIGLLQFSNQVYKSPVFSSDFSVFRVLLQFDDKPLLVAQSEQARKGSDIVAATRSLIQSFPSDVPCQRLAFLFTDGEQVTSEGVGVVSEDELIALETGTSSYQKQSEAIIFLVLLGDPTAEEFILTFDKDGNQNGVATKDTGEFLRTRPRIEIAESVASTIGAEPPIIAKDESLGDAISSALLQKRRIAERHPVEVPQSIAYLLSLLVIVLFLAGIIVFGRNR
jgi:hypothetical protein